MGGMRLKLTLILVLVLAAPARAGTYEHHTLSAISPGLDGWSPFVRAPGGFVATGAVPGGLSVRFWARSSFAPGDVAEWFYTPPADTTVASWEVERTVSGIRGGDWNTLFGVIADGRVRYVWHDVPSTNRPWGWVRATGLGAERLFALLQCGGPHACVASGSAVLALRGSRVTLHDAYAPVVSGVQGDLAGDGVLRGTAALAFTATDRGAGLYRAFAEVDGAAGPPVAIGDARCRDLGIPRAFAVRRPCPLAAGATVALDTTKLTEGRHRIAVQVEDAAGNPVTVYGPATRTVDNVPEPAPVRPVPRPVLRPVPRLNVTAWLPRRALAVTTAYGERVRVRGRVTDAAGRGVAGAVLDVAERVALPRRAWQPVTGVRALADGRFTAFTRVGPSRRLKITAAGGARAPLLTVRVRAPLSVRRSGSAVRGRLRGGYVPRPGALVELQMRVGRRWVTQVVVRTFSSGRFSARLPRGAVRAVVPRQPGLPYAAGRARAISPPRIAGRTAPRTSR
jgi:hypothetical protein